MRPFRFVLDSSQIRHSRYSLFFVGFQLKLTGMITCHLGSVVTSFRFLSSRSFCRGSLGRIGSASSLDSLPVQCFITCRFGATILHPNYTPTRRSIHTNYMNYDNRAYIVVLTASTFLRGATCWCSPIFVWFGS